ncbi:MAG: FixH family protein [Betaproteobacteria bacterium]|nr:FixH family protein [Betaproteobacteria bacterium]MDH5222599.1 FixH family protein [Betaproteobacteria bacterium]MDH5352070.1 FixH family protein [Betaproteobacteria bacterium]
MKNLASKSHGARRRVALIAAIAVLAAGTSACSLLSMVGVVAKRPAESEFGLGPRVSANQKYTATLQPREPLRLRRLQTVPVRITDAAGRPVEQARIAVDGGMPEHLHGLPTQPRLGRSLGNGVYELDGVRFSMGGWWEFKLAIESPAGADSVTFNLSL